MTAQEYHAVFADRELDSLVIGGCHLVLDAPTMNHPPYIMHDFNAPFSTCFLVRLKCHDLNSIIRSFKVLG